MKPADAPCLAGEGGRGTGLLARHRTGGRYVDPRAVCGCSSGSGWSTSFCGAISGGLRDAALDALGSSLQGRTLQIACVYGDLTREAPGAYTRAERELDVLDVLPVQLGNLAGKLPPRAPVGLNSWRQYKDAPRVGKLRSSGTFLPPARAARHARRATLMEALRVVRPADA
jgi:hypothetical protein